MLRKKSLALLLCSFMIFSSLILSTSLNVRASGFTGWIWEKSINNYNTWHYYNDGILLKNSWAKDTVGWAYLGKDGDLTSGWAQDSIGWVYLNDEGYWEPKAKWVLDAKGWYHIGDNGYWDGNAAVSTPNATYTPEMAINTAVSYECNGVYNDDVKGVIYDYFIRDGKAYYTVHLFSLSMKQGGGTGTIDNISIAQDGSILSN